MRQSYSLNTIFDPWVQPPYLPEPRGVTPKMWIATDQNAKMNVYATLGMRKCEMRQSYSPDMLFGPWVQAPHISQTQGA